MYAIVEIAGVQFRVEKNKKLKVPHLKGDSGSKINFDRVLFLSEDDGKSSVGKPTVKNAQVSATILEHGRDDKIIVFKKKRRKGYQVKNGHRQPFSLIRIDDFGIKKAEARKAAEEKAPAEVKEKKAEKKAPAAKTTKKATPAKTAAKKPAAPKKSTGSKPKAAKKEVKEA